MAFSPPHRPHGRHGAVRGTGPDLDACWTGRSRRGLRETATFLSTDLGRSVVGRRGTRAFSQASHRRSRMRAVRPTNVRDSRTTLRFPLNSAQDISAPPRPAEGALGPYLRAIRSHRLLVILVTLAAVAAAIAWTVLRTPTYTATAEMLVTPVAQDDQTFLGLQVLARLGRPHAVGSDRGQPDPFLRRGRAHRRQAGRRLDPQQGPGRDQGHARGREQHPRGHGQGRHGSRGGAAWPTPSPTPRSTRGATCSPSRPAPSSSA